MSDTSPISVTLMDCTINADELIAKAARQCYSSTPIDQVSIPYPEQKRLIRRLLQDGHLSVLEHASMTFGISGISRACSHQLVRHRLASYTQQSQRYTADQGYFVVPPSLRESRTYINAMKAIQRAYDSLIAKGYPQEDARYVLPNASVTNIVVTMNFRELLHFFELRCCSRAQWEIRALANQMLKMARDIYPLVFENAGANCAMCSNPCVKRVSEVSAGGA